MYFINGDVKVIVIVIVAFPRTLQEPREYVCYS